MGTRRDETSKATAPMPANLLTTAIELHRMGNVLLKMVVDWSSDDRRAHRVDQLQASRGFGFLGVWHESVDLFCIHEEKKKRCLRLASRRRCPGKTAARNSEYYRKYALCTMSRFTLRLSLRYIYRSCLSNLRTVWILYGTAVNTRVDGQVS
ncbi:unnamed protein product [Calypogeia fissa]